MRECLLARYRRVDVRVWNDRKFRALTPIAPSGQALWLYLLTGPHTGPIPGLFEARAGGICERLGWTPKAFREAFQEVFQQGMAKADWQAGLVWLPNSLRFNPPASPNVVRSWSDAWDELPECDLKNEAHSRLWEAFQDAFSKGFREALGEALGMPSGKALPNQEQEQEQELRSPNGDLSESRSATADIRRVFDRWVELFWSGKGRRPKLDDKRRKRIKARLRNFTPEQLCAALQGASTGWHADNGYTGIQTLLKDDEAVERHMGAISGGGDSKSSGELYSEWKAQQEREGAPVYHQTRGLIPREEAKS